MMHVYGPVPMSTLKNLEAMHGEPRRARGCPAVKVLQGCLLDFTVLSTLSSSLQCRVCSRELPMFYCVLVLEIHE